MRLRKAWGAFGVLGVVALVLGGAVAPASAGPTADGIENSVKPPLTKPTTPMIGQFATVSASSSHPESKLSAVNNLYPPADPVNDQGIGWASDTAVDISSATLTLTWATQQRINATEIFYNASEPNKAKNIVLPKAAVLQYRDAAGEYQNIPDVDGNTIQRGIANLSVFGSLSTDSLRVVFTVEPGKAVGVGEWYVYSVPVNPNARAYAAPVVFEDSDRAPLVDQKVTAPVTFEDGAVLQLPVKWDQSALDSEWAALTRPVSTEQIIVATGVVQPEKAGLGTAMQKITIRPKGAGTGPSAKGNIEVLSPLVSINVTAGDVLDLPGAVEGKNANGGVRLYAVDWDVYDLAKLSVPGSFTVIGHLVEDPLTTLSANVTVLAAPLPPPDYSGAKITINPTVVNAGEEITVSGEGFPDNDEASLEVWMHSVPVQLASGITPNNGLFRNKYRIPGETTSGKHRIEIKVGGRTVASGEFTVGASGAAPTEAKNSDANATKPKSAKNGTAVTGTEALLLGVLAGVIVVAGLGAIMVQRRRSAKKKLANSDVPLTTEPGPDASSD